MATPNIVPRSDSEGGLGTSSKYWASAYIDNIFVSAGFVGRDADNRVDFAVDNNIAFRVNGSNRLHVGSSHLYPEVNNSLSLGYATREFSDLFLGDGAVINFDNGDVTLTHATNNLAISGGNLQYGDNVKAAFGNAGDLNIYHNATDSYIDNEVTGDLYIRQLVDDKDIIFSCDDGSGGTTAYLTLDGSNPTVVFGKSAVFPDNIRSYFGTGLDFRNYKLS